MTQVGMLPVIKTILKRIRVSQPLNCLATSALSSLFAVTGTRSEFVIKHLPRAGTVRAGLPNGRTLRLWSRGDDWVSTQVYWRGWDGYETETAGLFFHFATSATTVLDVGAYVGFFSLLAAHANPRARVYAFEPLPTVYARLTRNVALNRLENVHCAPCAIGKVDGSAEFFHHPAGLPTNSSLSFEIMRSAPSLRRSVVPVITLDRFTQEHGLDRVDVVKIDTETTEPEVLRGMLGVLRRDRPHLFCEVLKGGGTERALEEVLRPLGYHFYLLTSGGPVRQDRIEGHPVWLNYLFTTLGPDEVVRR